MRNNLRAISHRFRQGGGGGLGGHSKIFQNPKNNKITISILAPAGRVLKPMWEWPRKEFVKSRFRAPRSAPRPFSSNPSQPLPLRL